MKCSQATALFDEYLNQTIQPADKKQLIEHLNVCSSCQKQWEAYRFFFENASIEEDFLVPSDLNAKIKYTIHQAKNNKKVPFFQNKQLLAGLTACSFLLVGTLWGASHYQQLKEASMQPEAPVIEPGVRTINEPVQQIGEEMNSQREAVYDISTPELAKMAEPISQESVAENPNATRMVPVDPSLETTAEIAAHSADEIVSNQPSVMMVGENLPVTDELKISDQWQKEILTKFPHEVLTEDTYLVTVTKDELEELIGCSVDADETKTQLTIQFVKISE